MIEREAGPFLLQFVSDGDGAGELTVKRDGKVVDLDRLNPASARRRSEVLNRLPDGHRDTLEAALRGLAVEARGSGGDSATGVEALREDGREIVHPTFDLRDGFLLYGFRIERVDADGKLEEVPVRVVSERAGERWDLRVESGDSFEVAGQEYVADPRWRPPLLEDRWSREGLRSLVGGAPPAAPGACYRRVRRVLHRHLDYADAGAYPVLAAFVLLTYVARAFPAVPYVGLLGPKGTGKSQTLAVLERLCFNAYKGRVTAAGLGDTTSALRGTVLVDQAQRLPEELLDLLVDGYRRDGGRRRVVDVDHRGRPHEFETFGPKALASAKGIDPDLMDRLVVIHTAPAARPVQPIPASGEVFAQLRADLYGSALAFWPLYVKQARVLEGEELRTRGEELWRPLAAVLQVAEAPEADVQAARDLYRRSAVETVAELGDWELALLDELGARFERSKRDTLELVNTDLLSGVHRRLGMEGDHDGPRPGKRWLGSQLDRLNLLDGKERRQVEGRRVRVYRFTRDRVDGQRQRFGLPSARPARPPGKGSGTREGRQDTEGEPSARLPDRSEGEEGECIEEPDPDPFAEFDSATGVGP